MIDHIFVFESTRSRQRIAPLLKEREEYLRYLLQQGVGISRLRTVAAMLLNIVRLFDLQSPRLISKAEIRETGLRWLNDTDSRRTRPPGATSIYTFTYVAEKWLRF